MDTAAGGTSGGKYTATEERALKLLGSGLGVKETAIATGVSESRISQLLSQEDFKERVTELRYENLNKHNERDSSYDALEDRLLKKFEKNIDLLYKPQELLRAITVINAAKRRGSSAPESITNQHTHVTLNMPNALIEKFTVNINNQVIQAGMQTLETIQAPALLASLRKRKIEETTYDHNTTVTTDTESSKESTTSSTGGAAESAINSE